MIEQARIRARRRLVGAAILVVAAVIGFPLLFDSKPRSLPADLGVELVHGDGHISMSTPVATVAADATSTAPEHAPAPHTPPAPLAKDRETPRVTIGAAAVQPRASSPKLVTTTTATSRSHDDAARVQALLEGQPSQPQHGSGTVPLPAAETGSGSQASSAAANVRYVVQIGAFSDATTAHDARMKVEKLGIKTYTQVISNEGGKRIRVRVGPFAQRHEAEQAVAKIKQTGLSPAVLTL